MPERATPDAPSRPVVRARRERALLIALGLQVVIVCAEVAAGLVANSVGLVADAIHNAFDVVALLIAFVAVRLATRRPTDARSFGWHRAEVLAALVNAALLLVAGVVIAVEAVGRLRDPEPIRGALVLVVAGVAIAGNGAGMLLLRDRHADLNLRAAWSHLASDVLASAGVAVAGLVELTTGALQRLDPAVALAIAVLIGFQAIRLSRDAVGVLLEGTPRDLDLDALRAAVKTLPGVDDVHDVHVWSISTDVRALSAHLLVDGSPNLAEAQQVGDRARALLADRFGIAHATLELEGRRCAPGGDDCRIESWTEPAATARHRH